MAEHYKVLHPTKYYRDHLAHKIRPDGREFDKYRHIIVNLGSIKTADGSALAKVGNTTVICGIKAELCKPRPDRAREGFIIPNIELPPLCSSRFKPGPPTDQAQVATQLVADILKNSQCLDVGSLCIFPDKLAWCLYADLICLDFDGSLIDACITALMAALKTVTLPAVEYDSALDNKQVNLKVRKPLEISCMPCSTTFGIFEDIVLIDPTIEEEDICTGQVIVVVKDNEMCLVHKPGGTAISDENLSNCIEDSKKRALVIEKLVKSALDTLK